MLASIPNSAGKLRGREKLIGLIPAAGKGVRLGLPYPKELYPIIRENRYKPVSQYVLENLTVAGVQHVVFVINETKHQLIGYFGDGSRFGCHLSYVVQEQREENGNSASPGLAHALNAAHHLTQGKIVCFGMPDTILDPRDAFTQVLSAWRPTDDVALGLFPITRPEKSAAVQMREDGQVLRIIDKPRQIDLPYGWACIVWRPQFTEYLNASVQNRCISDFAAIMNSAIEEGMSFRGVVVSHGNYIDLGTYEDIAELESRYRAP